MAASHPNRLKVLSRAQIEDQIAQGRHLIILDGKVLKCDAWMPFHPGGDIAIRHMVGRDATDEVNALHSAEARQRMKGFQIGVYNGRWSNFIPPIQGGKFYTLAEQATRSSEQEEEERSSGASSEESEPPSPVFETLESTYDGLRHRKLVSSGSSSTSLSSLDINEHNDTVPGWKEMNARTQAELHSDLSKYPPLDTRVQDSIAEKYRQLEQRLITEGYFKCDYIAYAIEGCRYVALFATSLLFFHLGNYAISGLFLGAFWHQLVFTAHDCGHMGITHDFQVDSVIGMVITDYLGGLSLGWWKRNHNVHHIVTNSPEHDPDIEHMPFFAISHRFFDSLRSTYYNRIMTYDAFAKFTVRYQAYLYYPILLFGRFNLYRLSWEYLILGQGPKKGPAAWHRWFELVGQLFFWTWFGYGMVYHIPDWRGRLSFILVSHMVTAILHVQITLSHFAMSTSDLGVNESFAQKMLRTTMDVDCPTWLDFFHGGLQFQAIHHLYPRMPRHNLRGAQKLVQQFCEETGIPYALYGFVDGNKEVIGRLGDVGRQATILAECQRVVSRKGVFDH